MDDMTLARTKGHEQDLRVTLRVGKFARGRYIGGPVEGGGTLPPSTATGGLELRSYAWGNSHDGGSLEVVKCEWVLVSRHLISGILYSLDLTPGRCTLLARRRPFRTRSQSKSAHGPIRQTARQTAYGSPSPTTLSQVTGSRRPYKNRHTSSTSSEPESPPVDLLAGQRGGYPRHRFQGFRVDR